jgi:class 3 adenylate cyclase
MTELSEQATRRQRTITPLLILGVILAIVGLPIAAWLDLRNLSDRIIRPQATETSRVIDNMRDFYASAIVARVLSASDGVAVTHNFRNTPGAIPIPATMSIELGKLISERDGDVKYRFVSDLPFRGREDHNLDAFEIDALRRLRAGDKETITQVSGSIFDRKIRMVAPVVMAQVCVDCHNSHPDSPKTDWKVGDVRGIQEILVRQPINANIFVFKYLLTYLVLLAAGGLGFILMQRRQTRLIIGMNEELATANNFLASISMKIAKYLSPQVYKGIFSGEKDVVVATERKKLTIFFSDIKDFTATTERLQPEELTALLNEYFTEMSIITEKHGGTVDKFIGDAMLVFFGDPETKGVAGDARACVAMAAEMQRRLERLNIEWRKRGVEEPFKTRIGINTGYCNVGNFGSDNRMDYTIIGAEANLAARLQSIAEPGKICLSYETFALVRDMVRGHPLPPIKMKGISREVIPYAIDGLSADLAASTTLVTEHTPGLDLVLDINRIDERGMERARKKLTEALKAIEDTMTTGVS